MKSSLFYRKPFIPPIFLAALLMGSCQIEEPESFTATGRLPKITPDYIGITIPKNIAPLHFIIKEPGEQYLAKIHSDSGAPIVVSNKTGNIIIPHNRWKDLVVSNAGRELYISVYVKTASGNWNQYQTIVNTIAPDTIDPYLVYRYMMPSSYFPKRMQMRQQNLENLKEETVLDTQSFGNGCAHCHTFVNHRPDTILIGIRSTSFPSATLLVRNGQIDRIGAKFGYTAWHPSGKMATYSINDVKQFFHSGRTEIHDVIDLDSMVVCYDMEQHIVKTNHALSNKERLETYPSWTPDGKHLYFNSAPMWWTDVKTVPPRYQEIKYDLMRISYDINTDRWGTLETVLSAAETGMSILLPRVSPDGRFLLFCMCEYGCFPVYQPSSDLYLMDLRTGDYQKLPINSQYAESWHSWSSNSRWIVFSSKRQGGVFTMPFISYVDVDGNAHKPFILPQKNPSFYDSCFHVYTLPEFITQSISVNKKDLTEAITNPGHISVDTVTGATYQANRREVYHKGSGTVQ